MEENKTPRKVNNKDVNPVSDLIIVEKLDWSKLTADINDYIHERKPERKDEEFYFEDRYSGLIEVDKGLCLLTTTEAVTKGIEIFDYMNGLTGFTMGIYVKSKEEGVINTMPEFYFSLTVTELPKIKTGEKMKLPDFMNERYKYNSRIEGNETELINFLKKKEYHRFKNLKK